ncbi:hypothetical protein QFC22_004159 [Naganishia vaughanmartiniae]|uniref:Uncharacterized protein n=1 Tax=Naganishia vaughanmartiniae TaxID=1424756 RepID=A0ACC2X3U4_9TREE|nr:hypothetical protein QFC22_004159 [Naganishia vaughanmartiniae]
MHAASTSNKQQSSVPADDEWTTAGSSYPNSSSSRVASGQTPLNSRPSLPPQNSHVDESSSTKTSSREKNRQSGVAALPADLTKITPSNRNSLLNVDVRKNGNFNDPFTHRDSPEDNSTQSTQHKRRKMNKEPPASIANAAKPLLTRDQRNQKGTAQHGTHASSRRTNTGSTKNGKSVLNVSGNRATMDAKGKARAVESKHQEVIDLDESEEELEDLPQQKNSLAAIMMATAAGSSDEPKRLESPDPRPPVNNVIAPASPIPLSSLHIQDDAPMELVQPRRSTDLPGTLTAFVQSNRKKAPARGSTEGQPSRLSDVSPSSRSPTTPLTSISAGRASESHISYAQRPSPQPISLPSRPLPPPPQRRSPSPCMFQGDGGLVSRPITERPAWVDEPPYIDARDTGLFQQIPRHLMKHFIALADEMDRRCEDSQTFRLEEYMELRGWKNQIVRTSPSSSGGALDERHVWAAQKCWRALQSADILEAEARGLVIFPSHHPATTHEETSVGPGETTTDLTNGKVVASVDPCTPKRRTVTVAQESPEFSVQPNPSKRKENADMIQSPGPSEVRRAQPQHQQQNQIQHQNRNHNKHLHQKQQRDEIQSPERMEADDPPEEDPIEENSDTDEIQIVDHIG